MNINPLNLSLLKLISSLSGYMHDFGKANKLFQSKIRGTDQLSDIIRHEFLSFYIILNLVSSYETDLLNNKNSKFITSEKWHNIFNNLNNIEQQKEFSLFKHTVQSLFNIKNNDYYSFNINEQSNPIVLCILLSVLTHHKLPCSKKNNQDLQSSLHFSIEYNNLNRIFNVEKDDFGTLKKNLQLNSNYYINTELETKINTGFQKVYLEYEQIKNFFTDKELFFKSFSILSRIFLIMSDHHVSSIKKRDLFIDKENNKTYANTNRDFNNPHSIPTFNQTLDEHLLDVGDTSISFLNEFSLFNENLPSLSDESIESIMKASLNKDFEWQDKAVDFIKDSNNSPTLILNMGTTGSGKTRMNVKALGALNKTKLRITSVFNLKSLTLQTGEAYRNQLNLNKNELSVLIGDKNYLDIKSINEHQEEFKIDNDLQATEQEYFIEGNFNASKDWKCIPSFIQNKKKNGYNVDDFIGVPVLTSTIDFCISAGDLSKGSNHNNAFLRIMTSDLIIDEIDTYEPEMLESVLCLITMSAMNKRNIVISSATLSKNYIIMIKKAFEYGILLGNTLYGLKDEGKIICISNLIDSKYINTNDDINEYINALCLKFSNNKQKKAVIFPLDSSQKKSTSIPAIFSAIKNLHLDNNQKIDDKCFSFGLIRVGKIKHAVHFAKKYLNTDFSEQKYSINNENVEVKFLLYHSNLINSKRFIIEEFLDNTLNQNTKSITNHFVLDHVKKSHAKHVIFIIIATPVEEIGRDHDFHWAIIEPSSVQSIIQTSGRVNRHRKFDVYKPNIYILQYNLSYYQRKGWENIFFSKPGLEKIENTYPQNIQDLLPWDADSSIYITSELRYCSFFAELDDKSISLSLNNLTFKFQDNSNYWFRLEYYLLHQLRNKDSDSFTYIIDNNNNKFFIKEKNGTKKGNSEDIDFYNNKYNNALILPEYNFKQKIKNNLHLIEWSNECNVSIYSDSQKEKLCYHDVFGFYFKD